MESRGFPGGMLEGRLDKLINGAACVEHIHTRKKWHTLLALLYYVGPPRESSHTLIGYLVQYEVDEIVSR